MIFLPFRTLTPRRSLRLFSTQRRAGDFKSLPRLGDARQKQLYLPDSNILLTRFLADDGVVEITDFMPVEPIWNAQRQAFVQYKGAATLDAASLLMPLMKFISPIDPRWLSTLQAIKEVLVDDSLVYRYKTGDAFRDGLLSEEGTFSMCSFWYVECLARAGDLEQARFIFEKTLGYANHLGLYSEELGRCGEHLRNFPQAFTHLALISAAYELNRRLSAAGHQG